MTLRRLPSSIFNSSLYSRIHEVWFSTSTSSGAAKTLPFSARAADEVTMARWYGLGTKNQKADFDHLCYQEFFPAVDALGPEQYGSLDASSSEEIVTPFIQAIDGSDVSTDKASLESAKRAISLVILLDQIPRNLFRSRETLPLVYSHYDKMALALARWVVKLKDRRLDLHPTIRHSLPYRQWFYMPLMHSEDIEDHKMFSEIMSEMREEIKDDADALAYVDRSLMFEEKHSKIIEEFGRYPYRNEYLGRDSTVEEEEWLKSDAETFGVEG